jgi:hypothetical protein
VFWVGIGLTAGSPSLSAATVGAPPAVGPETSIMAGDVGGERAFDRLRTEIADLKRKIEKPPKDAWDKVTAVSGLASGLAVALIGFYATNVYNRRQRISEERRRDQEVVISQLQTVEKFMPHLSSTDEQIKGAAIIAISALGNDELAIKLAKAFRGPGATSALTTIAITAGKEAIASSAQQVLLDVFKSLQTRVQCMTNPGLAGQEPLVLSSMPTIA